MTGFEERTNVFFSDLSTFAFVDDLFLCLNCPEEVVQALFVNKWRNFLAILEFSALIQLPVQAGQAEEMVFEISAFTSLDDVTKVRIFSKTFWSISGSQSVLLKSIYEGLSITQSNCIPFHEISVVNERD
jgi:hypothetical protein